MPRDEIAPVGKIEIMAAGGDAGFGEPIVDLLKRPRRIDDEPGPSPRRGPSARASASGRSASPDGAAQKARALAALRPATITAKPGLGEQPGDAAAEAAIAAEDENLPHAPLSRRSRPWRKPGPCL